MIILLANSYNPFSKVKPPTSKKSTGPQRHSIDLGFFLNERSRSIVNGKNTKSGILDLWEGEKQKFKKTLTESQKVLYAST